MTDFEKLKGLLTSFGVEFTVEYYEDKKGATIICNQGGRKVSGYNQFFTDFEFDSKGTFIQMGAWE